MKTVKSFGRGMAAGSVRVSLCDRNADVVNAFSDFFHDVAEVEILEGDVLRLDCDALVSPANSFGYMDGGIEQRIDQFYGGEAQKRVLQMLAQSYFGELPVGSAVVIPMGEPRFPFLIVAPTMRIPGTVAETLNAYLALRAALIAVLEHNAAGGSTIASIAIPGLGTGVGAMPPQQSAEQMRAAYDMILAGGWRQIAHPAQAPFALSARRPRRPRPGS